MLRHPSLSLYQPGAFPHHSTRRTPGGSSADSGPASLSPAAESLGTSLVAPPAAGEPEPSGRVYMGAIIAEGPWGPGASGGWGVWGGGRNEGMGGGAEQHRSTRSPKAIVHGTEQGSRRTPTSVYKRCFSFCQPHPHAHPTKSKKSPKLGGR